MSSTEHDSLNITPRNEGDSATAVATRPVPTSRDLEQWNVVLLDDDQHTYTYVIEMMIQLFGMNTEAATLVAQRVDEDGRAVCMTTHKEHAELKRDQIHACRKDHRISSCAGSMSALLEPFTS